MHSIVVLGSQWGDEGKGKIVDFLTTLRTNLVVRFQGGSNAGHTLVIEGQVVKLGLIPSGILHNKVKNFIANGVVVSIDALLNEVNSLTLLGVPVYSRLNLSEACPLVLPVHTALDKAKENFLGSSEIGTTRKGIGPAYEDKVARRALRLSDLRHPQRLRHKLKNILDIHNFMLKHYFKSKSFFKVEDTYDHIMKRSSSLLPIITDVSSEIHNLRKSKKNIIFEGAQGTLLDIDHGTYPFVTSCNTISGSVSSGAGFGPCYIDLVVGVTKAYTTRVGNGAYPTEIKNVLIRDYISKVGNEFGTVTKRKRRIGWLDLVLLKRSVEINSIGSLCLTKLDVLDKLSEIKVCTAYYLDGKKVYNAPYDNEDYKRCTPIYESFKGWSSSTYGCTEYDNLPLNAHKYLQFIENFLKLPIDILSTGPDRCHTILRRSFF